MWDVTVGIRAYEYNTSLTVIFLKTYSEHTLRCPYKDYSSLNRWQANRDKKVSILLPGDVNPGYILSR
jgi:hypothetical protein